MDTNIIKDLGKYQWEWLNKYGKINLSEWRIIPFPGTGKPDWFYIGNITPLPQGAQRLKNLQTNPYFYWPTR